MNIAVFDVGGTFIKHCLMIDGKITQAGKIPTPQDSQESFLKAIKAVLDKMSNIEGIAFSLPGVIDVYRQYIYAGGSLRYPDFLKIPINKNIRPTIFDDNWSFLI